MQFKDIQKGILDRAKNYSKQHNITIDENFALIKLYEEVGEFSQAVLIHRKQSRPEKHKPEAESKADVAKELADVIGLAIINAQLLDIDLEEALIKKWDIKNNL